MAHNDVDSIRRGNGRERGEFGCHDYLEIKDIVGHTPADYGCPGGRHNRPAVRC